MFELIRPYQAALADVLTNEITSGTFPQAGLLYGRRYSGRIAVAIEIARVLSCRTSAFQHCTCDSCRRYATLTMTNCIVVGVRDHESIISAALADARQRSDESSWRFLFQTVHLLLLGYHEALANELDRRMKQLFDAAAHVHEVLMELESADTKTTKDLERLARALKPLLTVPQRTQAVTIDQIRTIQGWTSLTSVDNLPRFVVLQGMEYSADGARNSLLKFLEDPPSNTYVLLISEHPARLLPTILSRLRRYYVPPLSQEAKNTLLAKAFSADQDAYHSFESYILQRSGTDCTLLSSFAERYAQSFLHKIAINRAELDRMCDYLDHASRLEYFFQQLYDQIFRQYALGGLSGGTAAKVLYAIRDAADKGWVFNQSRKLLVESLHYRLQEIG